MKDKTSLFTLFLSFSKIGLFTFGGGYAMLPMFERECVQNHKWVTSEDIMDYFAIAQCTPGVIAVNFATFVGHKERGFLGAVFATLGVITPSVIIIMLLASVLKMFQNNVYVLKAFSGIRIVVCVLILKAFFNIAKKALKDVLTVTIAVLAVSSQLFTNISPSFAVIGTLIVSLIYFFIFKKKEEI